MDVMSTWPLLCLPKVPLIHRDLQQLLPPPSPSHDSMLKQLLAVLCVAHAAALMPAARPLKLSSNHARAMPLQMSDVKGPKDWAFIKVKVRGSSTPCLDRPGCGRVVAIRFRLRLLWLRRRPRAALPPLA